MQSTLLEIAKPFSLLLCQLALYAVFHTAFLVPNASELLFSSTAQSDHILQAVLLFILAAGMCVVSGLLFQESASHPRPSLRSTLPVRLLTWSSSAMILLYVLSWYLETQVAFYRAVVY